MGRELRPRTAAPASCRPSAIGGYHDWPDFVRLAPRLRTADHGLAEVLGVPAVGDLPEVTVETTEHRSGDVVTDRLSWQLGYGPRTTGYFVRPTAGGPFPAVLVLPCHAGDKWIGAERMVDLGPDSTAEATALRRTLYGSRAYATHLAQRGFAVLTHDAFAWGSRRFLLDPAPERSAGRIAAQRALWREEDVAATPALVYNMLAADHENTIAKACTLLGTSFAGMVAHDDLAALQVLRSLPGVDSDRIGTAGFSGGGGRAMLVAALAPIVRSHVVSCMMTTFESLLPAYLDAHSWLLHTPGLAAFVDWPEIPFTARPSRPAALLVQYAEHDPLFPAQGMRDADGILRGHSTPDLSYTGTWWSCGHELTVQMQDEATRFLAETLR